MVKSQNQETLTLTYLPTLRPVGFRKSYLPTSLKCMSIWRAARQARLRAKQAGSKNIKQVKPAWLACDFWKTPRLMVKILILQCSSHTIPYLYTGDQLKATSYHLFLGRNCLLLEDNFDIQEETWSVQCKEQLKFKSFVFPLICVCVCACVHALRWIPGSWAC